MNGEVTAKLNRLNDAFWLNSTIAVRRFFPGLSMILTDGIYASAWPQVGGAAPFLAIFVGFFTGALFLVPDSGSVPIYSSSLLLMSILIAVSSFGAALGLWLFLGYILGDLCILRLVRVVGTDAQIGRHGLADAGYLIILYGLLAVVLISVPFISHRLRQLTLLLPVEVWNLVLASFRRRGAEIPSFLISIENAVRHLKAGYKKWFRFPFDAALQAVFMGLLIYLWTQAVPILLRSAYACYTYPNVQAASVSTSLIQPLQNNYSTLVEVGAFCGIIRIILEYIASEKSDFLGKVNKLRIEMRGVNVQQNIVISWVAEFAKIIMATLLLYGILEDPFNIAVTAIVLLLSTVVRKIILPRMTSWDNVITVVPLILRIAIVGAGTYFLSSAMMENKMSGGSFYPVLLPLWVCLVLSMFFFPDQANKIVTKNKQALREEIGTH